MPVSAPRFRGKLKREIADEAFEKHGPEATIQQVDAHFKRYGLPYCERSMYWAARRRAEGKPGPVRRQYRRTKRKDMAALVSPGHGSWLVTSVATTNSMN